VTDVLAAELLDEDFLDAPANDNPHHARRWWILAVLSIAQLMVVLDATVVTIALPSAQHALGFSNSDRQWIVTAYALAFGSLLLIGGRLADLVGRKRIFLIGLAGFAIASAVGGAANSFGMLAGARAVQGAFAALLAPAALALVTTTFTHAQERGKAFGVFGAIAGAGAALGLLLGGVLTEYASWRWTLLINLFFAGAAIVGGALLLHNQTSEDRPRLDWPGTVTVSSGLFALVYGFSHAATASWSSPATIASLAIAGVLLLVFAVIQTRSPNPLLPPHVVADRNRGGAYFAMFASAMGMFAAFLFLTYYMQTSLGYSAVKTGLAFLPMSAVLVASSGIVATVVARRVSPRLLIPGGMATAAVGMYLLTGLTLTTSYASHILPGTLLIGLGLGTVFSTAMNLATLGVEGEDAGVASAMVNTTQQVGGSIGTALLNTVAASAAASYLATHAAHGSAQALAAVHSYTVTFAYATGVFVIASVVCAVLLRSGVPQFDPDAEQVVVG
jgi:EmrB/QacA subfamily drug resistance transporter